MKKECVAMLLAGGQGSRLCVLTQEIAKPAIPIGGKYRIIDFSLSNCAHSEIGIVGVLTQYQPHLLSAYIGNGRPWGLDNMNGGVFILPPYSRGTEAAWYTGTANAIYQNIKFINQFDPEYVLILSGDHVYKMDYLPMIEQHKTSGADVTIAVHQVPLSEASRFGIMDCDPMGRITQFTEKPKMPIGTLASMGVYVFNWKLLRQYLVDDEADRASAKDFGKNIIPKMLDDGRMLYAYSFNGYWKDVGTIESLWETNMDLINPDSGIALFEAEKRIYYRGSENPPVYIDRNAKVTGSLIADGCQIYGEVENSVISSNVTVGKGARVQHSFVMPGAVIEDGAQVKYAIIAENARIGKYSRVGGEPVKSSEWGISVVGEGRFVGERCIVPPNQILEKDIMPMMEPQPFMIPIDFDHVCEETEVCQDRERKIGKIRSAV